MEGRSDASSSFSIPHLSFTGQRRTAEKLAFFALLALPGRPDGTVAKVSWLADLAAMLSLLMGTQPA
jgi:hypothetical protein